MGNERFVPDGKISITEEANKSVTVADIREISCVVKKDCPERKGVHALTIVLCRDFCCHQKTSLRCLMDLLVHRETYLVGAMKDILVRTEVTNIGLRRQRSSKESSFREADVVLAVMLDGTEGGQVVQGRREARRGLDSTSPFPAAAAATSFGVRVIFESPTSSMYPPSLRLVIAFSKRSGPENHDTRYLRHGIMATRMRGVLRALMGGMLRG